MLKTIALVCPKCNASLNIEEGRKETFCQYCGTQIILDDNSKIVKYYKVYRKIDEARIKEAEVKRDIRLKELENEEKEKKRANKFMIGYFMFMAMLLVFLPICFFIKDYGDKQKEAQGMIKIGSHQDFEGKNYEPIVAQLNALGFDDIELIDLDDAGLFTKSDTINTISINGNSSFDSDDYFNTTDKVIITYH